MNSDFTTAVKIKRSHINYSSWLKTKRNQVQTVCRIMLLIKPSSLPLSHYIISYL